MDAGDRAVQAEQAGRCSASETVRNDHVSGKIRQGEFVSAILPHCPVECSF